MYTATGNGSPAIVETMAATYGLLLKKKTMAAVSFEADSEPHSIINLSLNLI
jgi:hypothetical protein